MSTVHAILLPYPHARFEPATHHKGGSGFAHQVAADEDLPRARVDLEAVHRGGGGEEVADGVVGGLVDRQQTHMVSATPSKTTWCQQHPALLRVAGRQTANPYGVSNTQHC